MSKLMWIKYSSLNFIYNIDEDYIYDYDWNKIKISDISKKLRIGESINNFDPEKSKGIPSGLYRNTIYIFCAKNNKSTLYYRNINRVEDLDKQIDPNRDIIKIGDKCFYNGKKTICVFSDRIYLFNYGGEDFYPSISDIIIKERFMWQDRLYKTEKIYSLLKQ